MALRFRMCPSSTQPRPSAIGRLCSNSLARLWLSINEDAFCLDMRRLLKPFSTALYVDDLVQESELVERQTGAALGERSRLAARVAASPIALSPNGCVGRKSRIARRGKPR